MSKKIRITLTKVMAILALIGILIGAVGTSFLYSVPATTPTVTTTASAEVTK